MTHALTGRTIQYCTMGTMYHDRSGGSCAVMLLLHIHPLLAVCSCLALIDVRQWVEAARHSALVDSMRKVNIAEGQLLLMPMIGRKVCTGVAAMTSDSGIKICCLTSSQEVVSMAVLPAYVLSPALTSPGLPQLP